MFAYAVSAYWMMESLTVMRRGRERDPRAIWNGEHNHRTPFPGDQSIQFAPWTEADIERHIAFLKAGQEHCRQATERMRERGGLPPIEWDAVGWDAVRQR